MKHYYTFPPVHLANEHGIIGVSTEINLDLMESAYMQGIFPWPQEEEEESQSTFIPWFAPNPRAVFELKDFTLNRSWVRTIRRNEWTIKVNTEFEKILGECGNHKRRPETWITKELSRIYLQMMARGKAYCIGVYVDDNLVGGIFGIQLAKFISAESMFFELSGASKFALAALMAIAKDLEIEWIDSQVISPATATLGVSEISRELFMERLQISLAQNLDKSPMINDWHQQNITLSKNSQTLKAFIIDKLSPKLAL
ncbi:MAG: leucyl/phenylalanyl-tRNA--protein transferase [Bacteriovoracaceae bacterium]|nr:leucyl/phenylalanyl-tRNA--protein transferase [Bacteriovoracaceae bacterium]